MARVRSASLLDPAHMALKQNRPRNIRGRLTLVVGTGLCGVWLRFLFDPFDQVLFPIPDMAIGQPIVSRPATPVPHPFERPIREAHDPGRFFGFQESSRFIHTHSFL